MSEEQRIALARLAEELPSREKAHKAALTAMRNATEKEKKRAARAKEAIRLLVKEAGRLGAVRVEAAKADVKLKVGFVSPEKILAESAARCDVWNAKQRCKQIGEDVQGIRQNIESMIKRDLHADTISREERRAAEYEKSLAKADEALAAAEKVAAPAIEALEAAHAEARKVPDAAEA